jgi:hypothetical protein
MPNLVTNQQFAKEQLEMSRSTPEFPDVNYYEDLILAFAGDRVKLLIAATDLLEIARRNDPAYGLARVHE